MRRTGLALTSAGAWWCIGVALSFHEIIFISLASSPTEDERDATVIVVVPLGIAVIAAFSVSVLCFRHFGIVRSAWAFPVLVVAGALVAAAQFPLSAGPYGYWLSELPRPVLLVLWSGPALPAAVILVLLHVVLRVRERHVG
ncbi:MAG: hypothetical protein HDR73_01640 [Clavibacter sp.]|uniref:Integral membrane protein n=2 Tax=Microbacteriaceae TaxID=85023 RepID=B0RII4_CLASE|nr:hypothetical protein [Clavibacter sp.]OQJ49597.1 hypothetical protein B5P19_11200 [Clavibacter sepedonicus]OQJ55472.1 hypothetical protein B5P20_09385 [Clavibacter sepedonicus]CAQ00299.1 putative integral membrane protein [Clavibacter sepedonicus]